MLFLSNTKLCYVISIERNQHRLVILEPYSIICIVKFHIVGFSRADDPAEPVTETVDADIGSSREESRTGEAFISLI
jgi:hypothetical protein